MRRLDWKKRKKKRQTLKHYGFCCWTQYEMFLRTKALVQGYREKGWFKNDADRFIIARHIILEDYIDRFKRKHRIKEEEK